MDPVLYKAAVTGDIERVKNHATCLDLQLQITRNQNTVLHVYIIAPSESEKSTQFVDEILRMCRPLLLQENVNKETPLHLAVRHGHVAVVNYLIQMLPMTNTEMEPAIHEAIRKNEFNVVQSLIKDDPRFSYSANHAGNTHLNRALRFFRSMLENMCGVSPAYDNPIGLSYLHIAVIYRHAGMIGEILLHDATLLKIPDQQGWIPLHYAVLSGQESLVKLLLDSDKCTAYIADKKENKTALHFAASQGHISIIEELLSTCPDCCELMDNGGQNALDVITKADNLDATVKERIVQCLEGVGCRPNNGQITKPKDDDDIIVQFQKGKDPHLLVATLIATVSFAAGFTMPGGYISEKGSEQGQAILGRSSAFKAFLMSNTIALMLSSFSVMAHLFAPLCPDRKISLLFKSQTFCTSFAMLAMGISFITATYGVLRQSSALSTATLVLGIFYSILFMVELIMIYYQPQCVKTLTTTEKSRTGSKSPTVRLKAFGSDERNSNTEDFYRKTKESHLLVSILIATVTFTAGLTMPGGYITDKGHDQGTAVLIRSNAFKAFAVTNALVQAMSTSSVFIHIFMEMRDGNPILALFYRTMWSATTISSMPIMMIAYVTGTYAVLDSSSGFAIAYIVISILSLVLFLFVSGLLRVVQGISINSWRVVQGISINSWKVVQGISINSWRVVQGIRIIS